MTKPEMVTKAVDTVEITVNQPKQKSPPPWQRVPNSYKRKRTSESPPNPTSVAVSNRFTSLPIDQPESENNNTSNLGKNKPPPIVLYGIEDIEFRIIPDILNNSSLLPLFQCIINLE
ncbi:unnamed protein product [Colias eurytheme]|nr:unnamed protein product [Colias eurytheme]